MSQVNGFTPRVVAPAAPAREVKVFGEIFGPLGLDYQYCRWLVGYGERRGWLTRGRMLTKEESERAYNRIYNEGSRRRRADRGRVLQEEAERAEGRETEGNEGNQE